MRLVSVQLTVHFVLQTRDTCNRYEEKLLGGWHRKLEMILGLSQKRPQPFHWRATDAEGPDKIVSGQGMLFMHLHTWQLR